MTSPGILVGQPALHRPIRWKRLIIRAVNWIVWIWTYPLIGSRDDHAKETP